MILGTVLNIFNFKWKLITEWLNFNIKLTWDLCSLHTSIMCTWVWDTNENTKAIFICITDIIILIRYGSHVHCKSLFRFTCRGSEIISKACSKFVFQGYIQTKKGFQAYRKYNAKVWVTPKLIYRFEWFVRLDYGKDMKYWGIFKPGRDNLTGHA